jgi:predicted Zn finger-like uncharacterized protein
MTANGVFSTRCPIQVVIMPQIIKCPGCGSSLKVREELAGKKIKCPKCAHLMAVPAAPPSPPPAQAITAAPPPLPDAPPKPAAEEATVLPVDEDEPAEVRPTRRPRGILCPACGERNPPQARRCRACKEPLEEEEEEDRPRRREASYKPCPRCGARGASRVTWTFWGSFYGPALFTHVRCPKCGYAYNGRTGRSNLIPAIFFVTIPAILIAVIVVFVVFMVLKAGRRP